LSVKRHFEKFDFFGKGELLFCRLLAPPPFQKVNFAEKVDLRPAQSG